MAAPPPRPLGPPYQLNSSCNIDCSNRICACTSGTAGTVQCEYKHFTVSRKHRTLLHLQVVYIQGQGDDQQSQEWCAAAQ